MRPLRLSDVASALPVEDASVDALDPQTRGRVSAVWSGRAASELHAAEGFTAIARAVLASGGPSEAQWLAARAVSDEVRHAEICRQVASRYLAQDVPWPAPAAHPPTAPLDAPPRLVPALAVVSLSCVQETLGGIFLELCLASTTGALARAALRELLADEIDHGRIGWAYLAGLPAPTQSALGPHLPAVLDRCLAAWRSRITEVSGFSAPAHGCPDPTKVEPALLEGLRDVVLPGFEHVGLDAKPAQDWARHFTSPPAD